MKTILNFIGHLSVSGFVLVFYIAVAWTMIIFFTELTGFVYALVKKNKISDKRSGENGDENKGKKTKYKTNYETNYESQFALLSGKDANTKIIKKIYIDRWKLPIMNLENAQKIDSLRNLKQRIVHESLHSPSNAPLDE